MTLVCEIKICIEEILNNRGVENYYFSLWRRRNADKKYIARCLWKKSRLYFR